MRDPNRLYGFYDELQKIHIEYFPDWRFAQLISNFEVWLKIEKGINNMFFLEEDATIKYLKEYVSELMGTEE